MIFARSATSPLSKSGPTRGPLHNYRASTGRYEKSVVLEKGKCQTCGSGATLGGGGRAWIFKSPNVRQVSLNDLQVQPASCISLYIYISLSLLEYDTGYNTPRPPPPPPPPPPNKRLNNNNKITIKTRIEDRPTTKEDS